jgi:anhydro-N-acetylmuramic acid kinase
MSPYFIGLMSGTSLDGADGALVDFSSGKPRVIGFASRTYPETLRRDFLALNQTGHNELHRIAVAAHQLIALYADIVSQLLAEHRLQPSDIAAIGAHGQTIRHHPPHPSNPFPYTWQVNLPALLAELTHIAVVADFRSRDVAAGGQGAPLVPAFHREIFARPDTSVAVVNIGGIANVTALPALGPVLGLDTGPGNALLDLWCHRHTGAWYDDAGRWGATGVVHPALLARLLGDPYFQETGIKSTGRDRFHAEWLGQMIAPFPDVSPVDVQATLTQLTADSISEALLRIEWLGAPLTEVVVCGGGSQNRLLMNRLQNRLDGVRVIRSDEAGWPSQQVEAAAFAWLTRQTILGMSGNLTEVTGAAGPRILGAIYPA